MAIKIKLGSGVTLPERPDMDPILRNKQRLSRANRRLMALGQARVRELEARLLEGQQLTALANMIQKEWEECLDVKPLTLIKELERFKASRVEGKLLFLKGTDYGKMVYGEYATSIDVMEQMQKAVGVQQERVSKLYMQEQKIPTLMEAMRREISLLVEMYGQLLEMQMELGLLKRAPKEFSLDIVASKAQLAVENAMRTNAKVDTALREAFKMIEGEFTRVGA